MSHVPVGVGVPVPVPVPPPLDPPLVPPPASLYFHPDFVVFVLPIVLMSMLWQKMTIPIVGARLS